MQLFEREVPMIIPAYVGLSLSVKHPADARKTQTLVHYSFLTVAPLHYPQNITSYLLSHTKSSYPSDPPRLIIHILPYLIPGSSPSLTLSTQPSELLRSYTNLLPSACPTRFPSPNPFLATSMIIRR